MAKKKNHRSPQPEPQQKDDRVSTKELVVLTTALVQLLAAIITLVFILIRDK
ncbi:hypothetical protein [Paenibacillus popilliae]|uniref:Uncharacterized protein n=1 Tax=Paenibacillus popilliae ATCC 14706 TaxID=1212764 RepID=M9M2E3_PAEPP|nr:hypothetical protein [Paenibacillus popilliae]GAC41308.1 hypothetical protein PPOP_0658 [Paenibacillus popilliae ATCC 14706]